MYYSRYDQRHEPTWTLAVGTEKGDDYVVENLGDEDPSSVLWANETTIRVTGDLGSAKELRAIFLVNHNFAPGTTVLFQANSSNSWGAPPLSIAIPILADLGDFACNAFVDLINTIALAASRTYRWISIVNTVANDADVSIGEIWVAGAWQQLAPYNPSHVFSRGDTRLVQEQPTKRAIDTVYDMSSRERNLTMRVTTDDYGLDIFQDWRDEQAASVRPMIVSLDPTSTSRRKAEPRMCRFLSSEFLQATEEGYHTFDFTLKELGFGEPIV